MQKVIGLQERGLAHVLKWQLGRWREGRPAGAWLLDGKTDFHAAFPVHQLDPAALRSPASKAPGLTGCFACILRCLAAPASTCIGRQIHYLGLPGDGIQAAWLGHASVLVQMEGVTFLTDPVFSERCSPVQWMGPRWACWIMCA